VGVAYFEKFASFICRTLSGREIIFAAYSVGAEYFLAHTQSAVKKQNGG
jgi:hypothetical protein